MDEYGTFYNSDLSKQNINFDKKTDINKMESHSNKDPAVGYKNPIEVTDGNGIYYRSGNENATPEISVGSNYFANRDRKTGFCCIKSHHTSLEKGLIKAMIFTIVLLLCSYLMFFLYLSYEENKIRTGTNSSIPIANSPMPAMNSPIPATNSSIPSTSSPTPTTTSPIPTKNSSIPATNSYIPATNSYIPATNVSIPATSSSKPTVVPCHSPTCVETAGEILMSMNRDVKPCDNFFEFSCGGWAKLHPIPNNKDRWDTFSVAYERIHLQMKESFERRLSLDEPRAIRQLKIGYHACLNQSAWVNLGSTPLLRLLEDFGGLPMITPRWDVENFNFLESLSRLIRDYNEKFLIGIYVIPDMKDSSQFSIHMEQGILPMSRYLFSGEDDIEKKNQMDKMATVASILLEASLQKFKRVNKYKYRNHWKTDYNVPLFRIPANHSYIITRRVGDLEMKNFGQTYTDIWSNNTKLFRHPHVHSLVAQNPEKASIYDHYRSPEIVNRNPSRERKFPKSKENMNHHNIKRFAETDELVSSFVEKYNDNYFDRKSGRLPSGRNEPRPHFHIKQNKRRNPRKKVISPEGMEGAFEKQKNIMRTDIEELWVFYRRLAEIMEPTYATRTEDMYNPMTVEQLDVFNRRYNITWKNFLSDVMSDADIPIRDDTTINVPHKSYFEKLMPFIMETHPRVLANAILFQLILNMGAEVSPYREPTQAFLGRYEDRPWFDCAQKMNSLMSLAATRLYYDDRKLHFTEDINMVSDLVNELKTVLFHDIYSKSWLDDNTKDAALQKVRALIHIVGFPHKYLNNNQLDLVYESLPMLAAHDHFGNIQKLLKFTSVKAMSKYYERPSRSDFLSSPLDVNAFYSIQRNNIQIPMGILMSPFYKRNAIKAFHYGATGSIIAHELSHGFDVRGRKWDAKGNFSPWWGRHSLRTYMKKALCYVDQYKSVPMSYKPIYMNGEKLELNTKRTLAENIADSEGLHISWKAYMANIHARNSSMIGLEEYTTEQLFFIGYAQMWCSNYSPEGMKRSLLMDVHSPHPSRVNGAVRNHPQFSRVFRCENNTPMYSTDFCSIW